MAQVDVRLLRETTFGDAPISILVGQVLREFASGDAAHDNQERNGRDAADLAQKRMRENSLFQALATVGSAK